MRTIMEREVLINLVKEVGQELIDNAEEYVGPIEGQLTDFNIWIKFCRDQLPKIDVSKTYESENSLNYLRTALTKV